MLPDEVSYTQITEEFEEAKNELNNIIEEDLRNVKSLSSSQNKSIPFNQFLKPPSIIKAAFYLQNDHSQEPILFYYAHWTMSLSALRSLAQGIIEMSRELKTYYANYMNATAMHERRIKFNHFVSAYQGFNGYLASIHNIIKQYYDLFVQVCNEINPNNEEETQSIPIGHRLSSTVRCDKGIALTWKYGKTCWFSASHISIRSFHN